MTWAPPAYLDSFVYLLPFCVSGSGLNLNFSLHILMSAVTLKKKKGKTPTDKCLGESDEMTSTNTDAGDVRTGFTKKKKKANANWFFSVPQSHSIDHTLSECMGLLLTESWGGAWVKPPLTRAAASSSHSSPLSPSPPHFLILVKKSKCYIWVSVNVSLTVLTKISQKWL